MYLTFVQPRHQKKHFKFKVTSPENEQNYKSVFHKSSFVFCSCKSHQISMHLTCKYCSLKRCLFTAVRCSFASFMAKISTFILSAQTLHWKLLSLSLNAWATEQMLLISVAFHNVFAMCITCSDLPLSDVFVSTLPDDGLETDMISSTLHIIHSVKVWTKH